MAGLPLIKLSALLVKTISKPVAAFMKAQAQKEKKLADFFCLIGQSMHYVQSRINVIASGFKFVGVKPLPTDQALNDGVGTFSEILVLSISATLVIYEYDRGVKKDIVKNDKLSAEKAHQRYLTEARFQGIENRLHHIEELLERQTQAQEERANGRGQPVGRTWFGLGALLLGGSPSSPQSSTSGQGADTNGQNLPNQEVDRQMQTLMPPPKAFSTPENA